VEVETEFMPELSNRCFVAIAGEIEKLIETGVIHGAPPVLSREHGAWSEEKTDGSEIRPYH